LYFVNLLQGFPFNFGKNLIGVFIPSILTVAYFTINGYKDEFAKRLMIKSLILYLIQILPFAPTFFEVFKPTQGDDFHRYYDYANYMLKHHTLYGADELWFPSQGKHYLTQPGYRYFIAAELLLFGDLYRFVEFINIVIFLVCLFCFQKVIKKVVLEKSLQLSILILTLLLTPYAIKNVLMGLSEWLTVSLLMFACYLYISRSYTGYTFFILGLVPFFRQNIVIAVVLIALWLLLHHSKKLKLIILFLIPLLLPLYHNLYYAGEWRFLVKLHQTPLINNSYPAGLDFSVIFHNLFRLIGIEVTQEGLAFHFVALIFLPFSIGIYFLLIKKLPNIRWQIFYLLITISGIIPGLLLGKDYYPRFEFISVIVIVVSYCLLIFHLPKDLRQEGI
jgi:hypothetical protein